MRFLAISAALVAFLFVGVLVAQFRYQKWLDEEVVYIINDAERKAFERLKTGEERDQFIEAFWSRRNPTSGEVQNPFKDEHYRRIAYANERFGSGVPGWKTDRGRIYIVFGPPLGVRILSTRIAYPKVITDLSGNTTVSIPIAGMVPVTIYGRVTDVTHHEVSVFAETTSKAVYERALPLPPGSYHLKVVIRDATGSGVKHELTFEVK